VFAAKKSHGARRDEKTGLLPRTGSGYDSRVTDWDAFGASIGGTAETAAALREVYETGRASRPTLPALPPAEWVAQVAVHLPPDSDPKAYLRSLVAADVYLACACALEIAEAIATFEAEYLSRVPAYIAQIDGSPQFADEIRQILREHLLVRRKDARARIAGYTGRGALASWLRIVAVRIALDQRAGAARLRDDPSLLGELTADDSPELELLRARHAAALEDALKRALASLPSAERVLLRMYFSSGQNTSQIAAAFRVDRSTAARRLAAARQAVFDATKRILQEQLAIASSDFASLARALHDQLNLSLETLLAEPEGS
jgi:RNA polymerase sigma-70 factor (ECF subfamily)